LFLFAKHLFVAARRHIVFARHFAATTVLPLRKDSFHPPASRRRGIRFNKINAWWRTPPIANSEPMP
jgi:hypothetical protein